MVPPLLAKDNSRGDDNKMETSFQVWGEQILRIIRFLGCNKHYGWNNLLKSMIKIRYVGKIRPLRLIQEIYQESTQVP